MKTKAEFAQFMSTVASDRDLVHFFRSWGEDTIVICGDDDRALELDCAGTNVKLYYFDNFTNDAISYCTDLDLSHPESIDHIMEWLDKIETS